MKPLSHSIVVDNVRLAMVLMRTCRGSPNVMAKGLRFNTVMDTGMISDPFVTINSFQMLLGDWNKSTEGFPHLKRDSGNLFTSQIWKLSAAQSRPTVQCVDCNMP